jgi:molecular chaperone DnaJ
MVGTDPVFERDGYDIWCEIPITFMQAALGDEITVPTLEGKVKYNIPEGTQPGTVFRLKNRGVPFINGRGKGDQFVKVGVEVPKSLTTKQKQSLKDFESTLGDRNYKRGVPSL